MNFFTILFKRLEGRSFKLPLFIILISVWILSGLIGHHPWKSDDAVHFSALLPHVDASYQAVINQHYTSETQVTHYFPIIADELIYSRTNFFYVMTGGIVNVFQFLGFDYFLQLHDLARLSQFIYLSILIIFIIKISNLLYEQELNRYAGLVFIGNLGLLTRVHEFSPESAWLASCSIAIYGFLLTLKNKSQGIFWSLLGITLSFLIKDSLFGILLIMSGWILIYFSEQAYNNQTFFKNLLISSVGLLSVFLGTYFFLQNTTGELANYWFNKQYPFVSLNILDFSSWKTYLSNLKYYIENLIWYAFPSLPLALWYFWYSYRINRLNAMPMSRFSQTTYFLIFFSIIYLIGIITLPQDRDHFLLPLLISFSILALNSFQNITRNLSSGLYWFGISGFGFLIACLWFAYMSLNTHFPAFLYQKLDQFQPNYYSSFNLFLTILAIALTLVWLKIITLGEPKMIKRAIVSWSSSLTLAWVLLTSIWLPWFDAGKSYALPFKQVYDILNHYDFYSKQACISYVNVGTSQKTMLFYYAYLIQKPIYHQCEYLLVQTHDGLNAIKYPSNFSGQVIWHGSRMGDKVEKFYLIHRFY